MSRGKWKILKWWSWRVGSNKKKKSWLGTLALIYFIFFIRLETESAHILVTSDVTLGIVLKSKWWHLRAHCTKARQTTFSMPCFPNLYVVMHMAVIYQHFIQVSLPLPPRLRSLLYKRALSPEGYPLILYQLKIIKEEKRKLRMEHSYFLLHVESPLSTLAVTRVFLPQRVWEIQGFSRISGKQWVHLVHSEANLLAGQQLAQSLHGHSGPIHFHVHEQLLQHEQGVRGQVGVAGPVLLGQGQQYLGVG